MPAPCVDGSNGRHRAPSPRLALAVVLGSPVALQPLEIAQQSQQSHQMKRRTCHAAQTPAAPRAPKYPAPPAAPAPPTPPATSPARDPSPQRAAPPAPQPATPSTLRAATSATAACPNKRAPPPSSASRQGSALQSDTSGVQNLGGWLTTVVAHVCLDMLRSRTSRREESMESQAAEPVAQHAAAMDPEQETLLAESVGLALLVVLDTLAPAERLAFVLHDMFDVSFDEIAGIVGRSPEAARQLASRARRRVRGAEMALDADRWSHPRMVQAFIHAVAR